MANSQHNHDRVCGQDDATEATPALDTSKAPTQPGCYLMRDADGVIIYVGKARNLRARLRNYTNETDSRYSVKFLMRRVAHVEYLVVDSEKEALLLENNLIKTHKPRYNVRLRDDKNFISIRLHPGEPFPCLRVVRRHRKDGARYFGPYHDTRAARKMMKQMQNLIPLRVCSDHVMANRARPCLYHQMKQCLAPCVGLVSADDYATLTRQALLVLEGRTEELERRLREEISGLAEVMRFEEAAVLRDRLLDLQATMAPQRAVTSGGVNDRDVFGYYAEGRFIEIQALYYRNHAMVGGDAFSFDHVEAPVPELFSSFLLQFYDSTPVVPGEIVLPLDVEDREAFAALLTEKRGRKVVVRTARRGELRRLTELAADNARQAFSERRGQEKALLDTLAQIQSALHLPCLPERMECFDVSTIQGSQTVAAMVAFTGGQPDKQRYRRFAIRDTEGQDDFAAMREALTRRFSRGIRENDLPDFVLIDGGKGHLNVAIEVFRELGLEKLACAGIAKARNREGDAATERFFIPGRMNPIIPPQNGSVVRMLSRMRDEAHRFAITYHRNVRGKSTLTSALRDIPGVGPGRARTLLRAFGSMTRLRRATASEVAAIPGISDKLACIIVEAIGQSNEMPGGTGVVRNKENDS